MIYLAALLIIALMIAGRVAHGRDWLTKWLCFAPVLIASAGFSYAQKCGVLCAYEPLNAQIYGVSWAEMLQALIGLLPTLAAIVFICDGKMAHLSLNYMYRVEGSNLKDIAIGYLQRVGGFVLALAIGCYFTSWNYMVFAPLMVGMIGLCLWTAKDNRHIAGKGHLDAKHRMNYELSEGTLAGVNAACVWVVLMGAL